MSIVTIAETAIENGAKLVWKVTPGKIWIILGLAIALVGAYLAWDEHVFNRGYNKRAAEDKAYNDAVALKLKALQDPKHNPLLAKRSEIEDEINAPPPPLTVDPLDPCTPVDLARLRAAKP
jgi:hypothetical protein